MPNNDALTVSECQVISRAADEARHSCQYKLAEELEAILAPHPSQPEPRSEVTDDDKLCAERYRWLRERAWYVDAATYALELRERWRSGNEPPPDVDEVECALDAARTQGSKS
ncbi:putative gp39 [Burkholderia pseudomallei]|uniref:hypothetical protein n=1 Tax=Burkholderia pseudomallei TaxID=28450 RepID=UPI0003D88B0D|nr:hypothetical protein [Burkholderia pseudomallei]AHE33003.1 putative gp39 [Burkholderia pseudomallei NAU20B-16]AHG34625.1 putative gp39 [Burkholderia pseudomallei MSHR511]AHG69256.1 putative gp39 [Burkholderia pseudomallei MSHR146]KGX12743.1 putative gp39 [Burkholderia pseudomallei]KGX26982.1 putative gp39 [Burkholderia pseudomallei]